jgi:hypothetical protein
MKELAGRRSSSYFFNVPESPVTFAIFKPSPVREKGVEDTIPASRGIWMRGRV